MNAKEKPQSSLACKTENAVHDSVNPETPSKESVMQRTIKQIEAEAQSIKQSCGYATQEGINIMFERVEKHAQAVKDAAATYLQQRACIPLAGSAAEPCSQLQAFGDHSEERAREVDGSEPHIRERSSSIHSDLRCSQLD